MTDWSALSGLRCTCPPGCTTGSTWGDGPRDCDPSCRPCSIMRGRTYPAPGTAGSTPTDQSVEAMRSRNAEHSRETRSTAGDDGPALDAARARWGMSHPAPRRRRRGEADGVTTP